MSASVPLPPPLTGVVPPPQPAVSPHPERTTRINPIFYSVWKISLEYIGANPCNYKKLQIMSASNSQHIIHVWGI